MIKQLLRADPFKIFHIVFGYIIVFALWWGYLLFSKNESVYREKVELQGIMFSKSNPGEDFKSTAEYGVIHSKYKRQCLMILLEGSVFIVLMIAGLLRVRKVFKREIELAQQQKNFLLSITHELKSPLSTIKLSLQTLVKRKLEEEQQARMIGGSLDDLQRLEGLVDNILFAAKMEQEQHGFSMDAINIAEIVCKVCERISTNKKGVEVQVLAPAQLIATGDLLGFTSVVMNLVENAIKYSPEKSIVRVSLQSINSNVVLRVSDNGIGIPDEEKSKIFNKFYRVGNENTRTTKGTGLGLYIVKKYIEIFDGSIEVYNNQPCGTTFEIKLPAERKMTNF
ncbi:MAG: hypothetical protein JNK66_11790 [Chitinophagales bacterium]|nr:hypothetical protein [Chitinophagales bacterium]